MLNNAGGIIVGEFDTAEELELDLDKTITRMDYVIEDSGTNVLNGLVMINEIKINKIVVNGEED